MRNTGKRGGGEIEQVYAALPAGAGEPARRLAGWSKVKLSTGESREMSAKVEPLYLSIFNPDHNGWQLVPGEYTFLVGGSSQSLQ